MALEKEKHKQNALSFIKSNWVILSAVFWTIVASTITLNEINTRIENNENSIKIVQQDIKSNLKLISENEDEIDKFLETKTSIAVIQAEIEHIKDGSDKMDKKLDKILDKVTK